MRRRIGTAISGVVALVGASILALVLTVGPAGAFDVGDEAALRLAWGNPGESLIVLTADITLTDCSPGFVLRNSATPLRLEGNGHRITQTCDATALAQLGSGAVTLVDLTVVSGQFGILTNSAPIVVERGWFADQHAGTDSAAVYSESGSITATDTRVERVSSLQDAGGFNTNGGTIQLTRSSVTGVTANGFALGAFALGNVTVADSTIRSLGGANAVALYSQRGSIVLDRSTVTGLAGTYAAVGLYAEFTTIRNSTITGVGGPAVFTSEAMIVYSDIVGNGGEFGFGSGEVSESEAEADLGSPDVARSADFGRFGTADVEPNAVVEPNAQVMAETLTIFASVVASPKDASANCFTDDPVVSKGYNFADDLTCGLTSTGDTQAVGANPQLGSLADNGGPTQTLLPAVTSPLVNAIPDAACQTPPATGVVDDQRGLPRPALGACDIGSVELQPPKLTFTG